MSDTDSRKAFEEVHLGGNKKLAARESTTGRFVYASIEDAWNGWQARGEYEAKLRAEEKPVAWRYQPNPEGMYHFRTAELPIGYIGQALILRDREAT